MSDGYWYITLLESKHYWFDLIVRPLKYLNTREEILKNLKLKDESKKRSPHTRFIYFFASRPKVRICVEIKPLFENSTGNLEFYIRIGKNPEPIQVKSQILLPAHLKENCYLEATDRTLRFYKNPETSNTISIHDFLSDTNQYFNISTEILYVGSTTDEAKRFLNRTHRGVTDSIYLKGSESHDFFFFSNLFEVHEVVRDANNHINTVYKKSSVNLKDCKEESVIIENGLIVYFGCESQQLDKVKETSEYKNMISKLKHQRGISKFVYHLQITPDSSYYKFTSIRASAGYEHNFFHYIEAEDLETVKCNGEESMLELLHK